MSEFDILVGFVTIRVGEDFACTDQRGLSLHRPAPRSTTHIGRMDGVGSAGSIAEYMSNSWGAYGKHS